MLAPTRILPSTCSASAVTTPTPGGGRKSVSRLPSALARARLYVVGPPNRKDPPNRILPSGCAANAQTSPPPETDTSLTPWPYPHIGAHRKATVSLAQRFAVLFISFELRPL